MTYENSEPIRALVQQFIQERKYLLGVTPKTIIWYGCGFKAFEGAMESKAAVNQRIVELRERKVQPITVNGYLRVLNAFFKWSKQDIKISKLREEQKLLSTLTAAQIAKLIQTKPKGKNLLRAQLVCLVVLDCGLRISETLGLRKEDVNLENLTIKVFGKGGKHRLVPISKELRARLFRYVTHNEHEYLFPTRSGRKASVRNIQRDFKTLFEKAGIEGVRASPHTIRHSFAVCYLRNGGNLEFLRRYLGHSSLITTQKYIKSLGVEDLAATHNQLSPLARR